MDPISEFHEWHYLRHNQRRQEHLASLGLPLSGRSVLEVGAGIGDHTSFFLDRGCSVVTTEGRSANLALLRQRYPEVESHLLDLDHPDPTFRVAADVVYCYGTLYHLERPAEALAYLAARTRSLLLLETCVTPGTAENLNLVEEDVHNPSQALRGRGCRPTRPWVKRRLEELFPYVYVTATQPWHEEFPLEWSFSASPRLVRSVFVASRTNLDSPLLLDTIPERQTRH